MTLERIDVGCPGTIILVNSENRREYSIESRCRCGIFASGFGDHRSERPHMYRSVEEAREMVTRVCSAADLDEATA